jgi:hypothetical protein
MSKAKEIKYLKESGWISKEENGATVWLNLRWPKFNKYMTQDNALNAQNQDDDFYADYPELKKKLKVK